ncbi:Hypothetical Protein FCC1311_047102 [Hondaea fermentalgiana]|uniref:Uncharacterized protein n=1 Tax=Hondaea fermentalgiana TaxID=2315210 RepID=A0A2R5GBX6_9STRA|nr:Hypothetical Protein FCC1311_047102 [Hondaea fermentalgiana]|eukprot:GBG28487.1 Hypothetical Protein FCC1311_047102 [Hondaea fermentalgiana]
MLLRGHRMNIEQPVRRAEPAKKEIKKDGRKNSAPEARQQDAEIEIARAASFNFGDLKQVLEIQAAADRERKLENKAMKTVVVAGNQVMPNGDKVRSVKKPKRVSRFTRARYFTATRV